MAGFANFAVPLAEVGGGGLAEYGAARERYQKRQQALEGYKAGLRQLIQQKPQFAWLGTALEGGAPSDTLLNLAVDLMEKQKASSQERAGYYFQMGASATDPNERRLYTQAGMAAASGDFATADKILTHGGLLGAPVRPRQMSPDDIGLAQRLGLPADRGTWSQEQETYFENSKTALINQRRGPQYRLVQGVDANGNPISQLVEVAPTGGTTLPTGPAGAVPPASSGPSLGAPPSPAPPSSGVSVRTLMTERRPDAATVKQIQNFDKGLSDLDAAEQALRAIGPERWNASTKRVGGIISRGGRYAGSKLFGVSSGDPALDAALDAVESARVSATGAITSGTGLRSARIVEGMSSHVPRPYSDYNKLLTDIQMLRGRFTRGRQILQSGGYESAPASGGPSDSDESLLRRYGLGR